MTHLDLRRYPGLKDVAAERVRVGLDPAITGPVGPLIWSYGHDGYVVYVEPPPYTFDRPTTEETTTVTTATDASTTSTDAATTAPGVLRLTLSTLRALDACGPYLRRFGDEFPTSRYPDGVPLDEANCYRYYRDFDWGWARDVMLTREGQSEWHRLVESGTRAVRDRYGSGDARRARVTGFLLETRPDYRSERLRNAALSAAEREDERTLREVERARERIDEARRRLDEAHVEVRGWTRMLADREAALPALEARVAPARARRARRQVEALEAESAQLTARLAELADRTATARVELERLAATPDAIGPTDAGAPVDDEDADAPSTEVS